MAHSVLEKKPCGLNFMSDLWREIPGWEGMYEASTKGQIRSIKRRHLGESLIMKTHLVSGYHQLKLSGNGRALHQKVHRLVLETFVGGCPEGNECRHLNGNRQDNNLLNLRWGTKIENGADKAAHNSSKGLHHGRQKLTPFQVFMIRESAVGSCVLAKQFGVTGTSISCIKSGRNWSWL